MNPISKATIILQGAGRQVHLLEVGVGHKGRDNSVKRKMLWQNQVYEMIVLLSQQLYLQRHTEVLRTEVLNPLCQVQDYHHHHHYYSKVVGEIESYCQVNHIRVSTETESSVAVLKSSSRKYKW